MAGQERRLAGAGEEAEVLRLGLVGDGQPGLARRARAPRGLVSSPSGKRSRASVAGATRGEHVRLVLGRVGGARAAARRRVTPRVVAGGEVGRAEAVGELEHRVEPHVAVAAHARVRRLARRVAGQERLDDAGAELRAQVEREVRQAHPVRDRAREPDRVRRAARRLGVVLRVGPQLERDRDRLAPARRRAARRPRSPPRRSSPRACGPAAGRRAPRRAHAAPSARCSASAARSAAWSLPATARRARRRSRARRPGPRRARARPRSASRRPSRPRSSCRSPRRRSPRRHAVAVDARPRSGSGHRRRRRRPRRQMRPPGACRARRDARGARGRPPRALSLGAAV